MPAVVVSTTDQVEAVKTALGSKGNVMMNDDAGNELANLPKPVESTDNPEGAVEGDTGETDKPDSAASEGDKPPDDKTSDDSATSGKEGDDAGKDTKAEKRIKQLVKKVGDLEAQLAGNPQPSKEIKDKPDDVKPPVEDAEPKPDDYDTQADYMKALSRWAAKQARREQKAEDDKAKVVQAQNQVVENWKKQVNTAKAKYTDWDTVMDDTVIGNAAAKALVETSDGAELAYYIAKHPDVAKKLSETASEREVLITIGEVRAAVKASQKPPTTNPTAPGTGGTKPKPITPVSGSGKGGTNVDKPASQMSYLEYKAKRNREIAARRNQRA